MQLLEVPVEVLKAFGWKVVLEETLLISSTNSREIWQEPVTNGVWLPRNTGVPRNSKSKEDQASTLHNHAVNIVNPKKMTTTSG